MDDNDKERYGELVIMNQWLEYHQGWIESYRRIKDENQRWNLMIDIKRKQR